MYRFNKSEAVTITELIVANKTILNVLKLNIVLLLLMKSNIKFFCNSVTAYEMFFFHKTFL